MTEMEFVRSLTDRQPQDCRGPLAMIELVGYRLGTLEESFGNTFAHELLWDNFLPQLHPRMAFQLCSAHWMDLSYLSGMRAYQFGRPEWLGEADVLLRQTCDAASWDVKEIANMLRWQHVQLT